jgi:uncharacterized membrane protein
MTEPQASSSKKTPLVISDSDGEKFAQKLRWGQRIFLPAYTGLLVLFTLLNMFGEGGGIKLWLVQCLPLLIFIPGLLRQQYRTYSWICFVILAYFTWSVVNTMSPLIRWHDVVVVILTVIIFISAMMVSRWLQYWQFYQRQSHTADNTGTH